MSRKYGKNKSHGGAGLQFDRLLKACNNSKKPSVTKTAGALGRFGIASFTSTRNASFDTDSCGEEDTRFKLSKRPRFDVAINIAQIKNDSYHFGENLILPPPRPLQVEPPPMVVKPRKFFKSRGTVETERSSATTILSQSQPTPLPLLPPIEMPITIPIPKINHSSKKSKSNGKKEHGEHHRRRKDSILSEGDKEGDFQNITDMSPTGNGEGSNNNSTSPSIKLRIFKDKKTSKFVSVADTFSSSLPPKLDCEVDEDENQHGLHHHHPKKRGRKPKGFKEDSKLKPKPEKVHKSEIPQRRSGRLTRNSSRLERSESNDDSEMPILTAVNSDSDDDDLEKMITPQQDTATNIGIQQVEKIDSAEKLVQRLEEEDSEFRELTAMLSSMESDSQTLHQEVPSSEIRNQELYQEDYPFQPSPINYSTNPPATVPEPIPTLPLVQEQRQNFSEQPTKDFRSILEDEWDESYEEDSQSPRKLSTSPNKVSRFDMPEFINERSLPVYKRTSPQELVPNESEPSGIPIQIIVPHIQQHLNSSYSVRSLLSQFTGNQPAEEQPTEGTGSSQPDLPEPTLEEVPLGLTLTPEKSAPPNNPGSGVKKASIFKSRINTSTSLPGQAPNPKKRLALYRHKFGQETTDKVEMDQFKTQSIQHEKSMDGFDEDYVDASEPLSLRRGKRIGIDAAGNTITEEGSKVYCSHETKRLFTVIRNVKAIHELQESGEVHEFDGDIWYILEDLKESNTISSRCLSAITLAMRCMEPAFRMHLRAHGTVAEFSRELHDAPNIPVLGLAAATVLFVLSQDRLNMDLDTESFQLILSLAKTDQNPQLLDENPELSKHKQRIIDLVIEMKNRGHAKHIKIEKITASELALETLLFLTSKRAGEWVKRELRTLGGLDYIVTEVEKSLCGLEMYIQEYGWSESSELLWKIDRCLKVLQQVTFNHEENQKYLLGCGNQNLENHGLEVETLQYSPNVFVRLFQFLSTHLAYKGKDPETSIILREILFSVLRVLVNLTHDYRGIVLGSEILSSRKGFLELTLHSIFTLSTAFSSDGKAFDLLMHSLCMLLNIVEHSRRNRELVLSMSVQVPLNSDKGFVEQQTLDALIQMFFQKESEAKKEEASTDDILTNSTDKKEPKSSQSSNESQNMSQESRDSESSSVQDIIDKLIETAGKHMENSMIAAHISLLIAYLIMDNPTMAAYVQNEMPNSKFLPLMVLLKKLFNFMAITTSTSGSTRGLKATSIALKFFEKCDPESAMELKNIIPD